MKGSVVYIFAFDLANEIRTRQVREILSRKPFPFQLRLGPTAPRDVPIYSPSTIALEPVEADANIGRVILKPVVKVFDVGAISLSYEVLFDKETLLELIPYHQLQIDGVPLSVMAERLAAQVADNLRAAMIKPNPERPPVEAYTAFCLREIDKPMQEWIYSHKPEIAALLTEETGPDRLSLRQIDETVSHSLTYTRDDYTIIDWDAALVVDMSGYFEDVTYILELANLQLEEFRILDDRLDRLFTKAYEDLEQRASIWGSPFRSDARLDLIRRTRMDITKMSEEVSNITKFVGDWYLARVYLSCKHRFHLGHWEASVDQKLHELDRLYSLVHQEASERRMLVLELIVVALFLFEVSSTLFLRH